MTAHAVGSSPRRVGGVERVTGTQRYAADIRLESVLHVKLVTVDAPRARIASIDKSRAESMPGVAMVMTPDDLPKPMPRFGPQFRDRPILAAGETKYHGEPVAAVAAESLEEASRAAAAVEVQHEVLEGGVFSVADALDPDSPLVQDPSIRSDGGPLANTNILSEHRYGWGDIDGAEADVVIDETYRFPMITQFAIEPHVFMAAPGDDGIEVWSSIQHPFLLQKTIASILNIPLSKVRVHAPDPGGGFGGKQNPKYEPLAAFLAMTTGRPVRLVLSLGETFQAVRRSSAQIRVRTGFGNDGTLVFQDFQSDFLIGAYVDIADRVVQKSNYLAAGPYRVPNVRIVARGLLSHTTPSTAMRGFGIPQVSWARESNIDEAARRLGIDRVAIRLQNLAKSGEEFIPNETPADGEWAQAVERAAELIDWDSPETQGRGKGFAISLKSGPTTGLSYSTVRLLADGSAVVYAGTSDMGQGARTIFAQMVSEDLGVPVDRITVVMGDTSRVPYDQQTSASRSSVLMGNAVARACDSIRAQLRERLAEKLEIPESEIVVESGVVRTPDGEDPIAKKLPLALGRLGGEITGNGEMRVEGDPSHPLGGRAVFYEFHCAASEVRVDDGTGEMEISKYVTVGDVGRAVNPRQVAGQDEGAAIMGLGHTLMERMILDETGRIRNMNAVDYRILTAMDVPTEMVSDSIENADGPGPYGIKGVSEGGLLATSPAIGSAVAHATGAVIRDLPLTPERVWQAMNEAT